MLRLDRDFFASLFVQRHHVASPRAVEEGHHPGLAIQGFPVRALDHHPLAKERALSADFLVESLQCAVGGRALGRILRRR